MKSYQKREIELNLNVEVTVKALWYSGETGGTFNTTYGQHLPKDGPEVSGLRVFLGPYDITEQLSKAEIQEIETDFEEVMREEDENGK